MSIAPCYAHSLVIRASVGMTVCPGDPWWAYVLRVAGPFIIVALPSLLAWRVFGAFAGILACAVLLITGVIVGWFPPLYLIPAGTLVVVAFRPWEFVRSKREVPV